MKRKKDFKTLRIEAGYSIEHCIKLFDVNSKTLKNWETGKTEPPRAVFLCLEIFAGKLDFLGEKWRGFRITEDCIESAEGDFVYHYEIRAIRYIYQAAKIERFRLCRNLELQNENDNSRLRKSSLRVTYLDQKRVNSKRLSGANKEGFVLRPVKER